MRITKDKALENRERVIEEAAKLFRERGFDRVGVAELMGKAGLTHGGFYNHFASKAEMEAAACASVFKRSVARMTAAADAPERDAAFAAYRERYVSTEARDATAAQCPMVAFAADVSRGEPPLKETYARGLADYLAAFERASGLTRAEALRAFSTMAGALILARSVAAGNPALSDEILASARD